MISFDQFWADVRGDHQTSRSAGLIDWEILPRGEIAEARGCRWRTDWLRFSSENDTLIYGWLARPADHAPSGVGFLWIPGYSYGTPRPDSTNLVRGAVTLCINLHGNPPETPYVNPSGKNDYITAGIDHPKSFVYRAMVLHCLHAMDILGEIEGVDSRRRVSAGMSQGGALAMLVAASHDAPRLCFADMPFLCSVRAAMSLSHSPVYKAVAAHMREHPERAEQVLETLCLFDPLYHAPRITIPSSLTAGGKDPASRAATIGPVYDALASPIKQYRLFPNAGHVFLPEHAQIFADWIGHFLPSEPTYVDRKF